MNWHDAKTNPPIKNGEYLCAVTYSGLSRSYPKIYSYAKNLEKVDKYDFQGKKRPGWFYYDSEWGYVEANGVTHWRHLPPLPGN